MYNTARFVRALMNKCPAYFDNWDTIDYESLEKCINDELKDFDKKHFKGEIDNE